MRSYEKNQMAVSAGRQNTRNTGKLYTITFARYEKVGSAAFFPPGSDLAAGRCGDDHDPGITGRDHPLNRFWFIDYRMETHHGGLTPDE